MTPDASSSDHASRVTRHAAPDPVSRKRRRRRALLIGAASVVGLGAAFYGYGLWEARQIRIVEVELFFEGLPRAFDGLRVIHLSDLHTERFGAVERRLRQLLLGIRADLLVCTGDFKATPHADDDAVLESLDRIFEGLEYPWGFLGCAGDHDTPDFYERLKAGGRFVGFHRTALVLEHGGERLGILGTVTMRPLDWIRGEHEIDECTWVGNVAVRRAPWGLLPDTPAHPRLCDRLNDGRLFRILLAHSPDHIVAAKEAGIDLVLAGDTHGGQIRLPLVGPVISHTKAGRKYSRGHFVEGRTQMYINPGIGTLYLPIRFLCPPEITVLTLRRSGP